MNSPRPELRLDWCSHAAAKYAVERWHYLRKLPVTKNVYVGAWEGGRFVGALVYGMGGGSATDGRAYGLRERFDLAELARVALGNHQSPVTRMISIANKMMSRQSPGLRCIVSYADPEQGHHGGIYQGGNWVYVGPTSKGFYAIDDYGVRLHSRALGDARRGTAFGKPYRSPFDFETMRKVITCGKHKYLYPLDDAMRAQLAPLAKPYPKRASEPTSVGAGDQPVQGGATPTRTLEDGAAS